MGYSAGAARLRGTWIFRGARDRESDAVPPQAHCLAEAEAYDGARDVLTKSAGPEALEAFEADARNTWGRRFLKTRGHAGFVGGLLRRKLLEPRRGVALCGGRAESFEAWEPRRGRVAAPPRVDTLRGRRAGEGLR